jgi:hypothetical protein
MSHSLKSKSCLYSIVYQQLMICASALPIIWHPLCHSAACLTDQRPYRGKGGKNERLSEARGSSGGGPDGEFGGVRSSSKQIRKMRFS